MHIFSSLWMLYCWLLAKKETRKIENFPERKKRWKLAINNCFVHFFIFIIINVRHVFNAHASSWKKKQNKTNKFHFFCGPILFKNKFIRWSIKSKCRLLASRFNSGSTLTFFYKAFTFFGLFIRLSPCVFEGGRVK